MSSPEGPPTGAQRIARRLAAAGCRHVFGIPGGEVLVLLAAFEEAGMRFVLVRHENAGGFMAEGTHHATGAPGVLLATVGPGVANLVNVVANAQQDRVPLVVVTGRHDPREVATYTHQIFDHRAVLAPLCKASFEVAAGAVEARVDQALSAALDGRPGPVHLDVPIAVAAGRVPEPEVAPRPRPAPAVPASVVGARAALEAARRPLILAGLDLLDDRSALRDFAEALGAPVLTTYKAKGVLPEDHRLSLGAFGLSPLADATLLPFVKEADVVVLAGYDPIEVRKPWREPFGDAATVIAISAEADRHGVHRVDHLLVGDVAATLNRLRVERPHATGRRAAEIRASLRAAFPRSGEGPGPLLAALEAALPPDARWTVDTGAHRILLSQQLRCTWPRQLLQSSGFCTMGCALPLAIGAKLAEPERPVVAVVGDGGLEMVLGELATLRDLGLPVLVVVIDDRSLALIEKKQRAMGLPSAGVDFGGTDFVAVAEALGGAGERVDAPAAVGDAVARALARTDRFTVLHCPIAGRAYDGRI